MFRVRITVSEARWGRVIGRLAPLLEPYSDRVETLSSDELEDLLYKVMRAALAHQHMWLAACGIGAVISPDETSERRFIFSFSSAAHARRFAQRFAGDLLAEDR